MAKAKKKTCRGTNVSVARQSYRCRPAKKGSHRLVCCYVGPKKAKRKSGPSKAATKRHEGLFKNFDPMATGPMEGLRRKRSRKARRTSKR